MQVKNNWTDEANYCQCGCGIEIKKNKDFVVGHHRRNVETPEKTKIKQSKSHKGKLSPTKGKHHSEESKKILSIKNTGKVLKQETKEKIIKSTTGKSKPEGFGEIIRTRVKKMWCDPKFRDKQLKSKSEKSKRQSKSLKKIWQDPEFAKMMGRRWRLHPNKPETIILNLLQEIYPNEWKYTGDLSFIINGKNPDFVNVNGQKKIIELFGDYWHRGQDPQDRINIFKPFGWDTLIIWERELKNIADVKTKIMDFVKKKRTTYNAK